MPTDPVLTLIAEVRQLCDAMPEGPYTKIATLDFNEGFFTTLHLGTTEDDEYVHFGDQNQHHARYFAALDPALVRALLDVAEAQVRYIAREEATDPDNDDHLPDYYAAIQGWTDAISALRTLATDRVAS